MLRICPYLLLEVLHPQHYTLRCHAIKDLPHMVLQLEDTAEGLFVQLHLHPFSIVLLAVEALTSLSLSPVGGDVVLRVEFLLHVF